MNYDFAINVNEYFTLNKLSLGAFINAVLAMVFFIVFFCSYFFVFKNKLIYFMSKFSFFIFLITLSFGFFTNSRSIMGVTYWHKICFISSYMLYYTIIQINELITLNDFKIYKKVMKIVIVLVTILLFLDKGYILGQEVIFDKYPHLSSGKFYYIFAYIIPISVIINNYKTARKNITIKDRNLSIIKIFDILIVINLMISLISIKINELQNLLWFFLIALVVIIIIAIIKNQNKLSKELQQSIKDKEDLYEKVTRSSLTGVYSRSYVRDMFNEYSFKNKNDNDLKKNHWVAFMDIDNFKKINDFYGHVVGDKILKEFGEILLKNSKENYIPSRYGGDEFMILIKEADKKEVEHYFDKILLEFEEKINIILNENNKFSVGLSIGIVGSNNIGVDFQETIMIADNTMYKAKAKGGNRYYFFD
ncbi:GGDEF domain-containing protein [Clostridium grantii]|uniref:Diguanylate cyclase (GGDEF) domain-containing protein n=1 Tax=Clostridium grantii DSM 8605 TaxID=1121316 RepID=A0A1M5UWL2_9CLOT|nr:GGDEF domain-containing protein [Clostridium grantii]SHH67365.1 diguanylate cyclase (GGDEF) domain-containing protein [Clostridium grantii DSM 8605]